MTAARLGPVGGDEVGERVGVQKRDVTRCDHDDAVESGRERVQTAGGRVAGAQLFLLHRDRDGAAELAGQFRDGGGDRVAVVAQHHDQVLRRDLGHRVQCVRQHAAAGQRVQHFRDVRPHPGTGPGGEHDHRRVSV